MSCANYAATPNAHGSACTSAAGQLLIPDLYDRIENRRLRSGGRRAVTSNQACPRIFPRSLGYRSLTNKRIGALLKNGKRMRREFNQTLSVFAAEFHFPHGLYLTLASGRLDNENAAREVASEMCADLKRRGCPSATQEASASTSRRRNGFKTGHAIAMW